MATSHHQLCAICLEVFKQPKFLDCHHTFCLECLRGLENKTPGSINCPLCQRKAQLPSGGVDKLTTNFYFQDTPLVTDEGRKIEGFQPRSGFPQSLYANAQPFETRGTNINEWLQPIRARVTNIGEWLQPRFPHTLYATMPHMKSTDANLEGLQPRFPTHHMPHMKSIDDQPVGASCVQDGRTHTVNEVKGISEKKTIHFDYPYYVPDMSRPNNLPLLSSNANSNVLTESFCGVSLVFSLFKNKTEKWGETLALNINLSHTENPFIIRQVEYDITLVNKKDDKFSLKKTGQGSLQTQKNISVDLIKLCYTYNNDSGFYVECIEEKSVTTRPRRFQLDIGIAICDTRNMDFNLN